MSRKDRPGTQSEHEGNLIGIHKSKENRSVHTDRELDSIALRYNLEAIYVFGSRAKEIAEHIRNETREKPHPESDVDIGVQPAFGFRLSARERVLLTIALEEHFQVQRVDLVVIPEAEPFLALDIIRGEILYCKNQDDQAEHELFILRRAGDLASYERTRREQIFVRND